MRRIICIGNRYVEDDSVGPRVFDRLGEEELPGDLIVDDGGLAGLDLLSLLENTERVVFVDQVTGFADEGEIVTMTADEVLLTTGRIGSFDHQSGLPFLLACADKACDRPPQEMLVVGVEGDGAKGAKNTLVREATRVALELAAHGMRPRGEQ
jgi:hydrogenase maturation protease